MRPAPAYIYNTLGVLLQVLYSNEIYEVEQLVVIEDTIDNNTTTIIDPLT